jgi:signal transduction histidine kinase
MRKYIEDFRVKVALAVSLGFLIFVSAFVIFGYVYNRNSLRDTTGESHKEMARLMAENVSALIDKEIALMNIAASGDMIYEAAKESNLKYSPDEKAAAKYLEDMDKKWIESSEDHSLVKGYLDNKVSSRLRSMMAQEKKAVSILVTDRFGGLIGATNKTSDFCQSGKDWWKDAYNSGSGAIIAGNVVFEERGNIWCVPFAVPVRDRSGEVVGIYRSLLDISIFFPPLENFKISDTGKAALVDDKGYLVYQRDAKPFANKFCGYEDLQKVSRDKKGWLVIAGVYSRAAKAFVSFSDMGNKLFTDRGIIWRVFVTQDAKEVFAPLNKLFLQIFLIGLVLIMVLASAVFIAAELFMGPVRKMREGIDRIARGDLDYRIDVSSEAELTRLADSVNGMVITLKSWAPPVANLDKEMLQRRKLEDKLEQISSGFLSALSGLTQPIQKVKEGLSLILEEMPKIINDRQKKAIIAADSSLNVISENVGKLLDTAKLESGKVDLNKRTVDIRSLLRNAIFVYEPKIRGRGLDLQLNVPKEPVNVSVDADKITKAINSLIDNSVKFTERGTVTISIREFNDDVECSVSDTGVGIKPADIPGVFRRFPGLGLAIAKDIVELHNGKISIESEFGKGTKLTFKLPKLNPVGHT